MATTDGVRNAIQRALAHGGAAAVRRICFGRYTVESASRPGTVHSVTVDARGQYRCSCEAGIAGRPACWHRAAVFIAKVEHGGGRVVTPAAPMPAPVAVAVVARVVDIRARRAA
jgi:hypothetical protein